MGQRSPETVELPHHQAVARLEERQRLRKASAIVATAAGTIFKQCRSSTPAAGRPPAIGAIPTKIAWGVN
jgi:hypothetical protein